MVDNLRAILRTKEKNYCMTVPLAQLNTNTTNMSDNTDQILLTPHLICRLISAEIKIKYFYPLTDFNVRLNRFDYYYYI